MSWDKKSSYKSATALPTITCLVILFWLVLFFSNYAMSSKCLFSLALIIYGWVYWQIKKQFNELTSTELEEMIFNFLERAPILTVVLLMPFGSALLDINLSINILSVVIIVVCLVMILLFKINHKSTDDDEDTDETVDTSGDPTYQYRSYQEPAHREYGQDVNLEGFGNRNGYSGYGPQEHYEPGSQYRKDNDYQKYYHSSDSAEVVNIINPVIFSEHQYTPEEVKCILAVMGYVTDKCSSADDLKQICIDEQLFRMNIPQRLINEFRDCLKNKSYANRWNLDLLIRESKSLGTDIKFAANVFYCIMTNLFYDEMVSQSECKLFGEVGSMFHLNEFICGSIFKILIKEYNLYFDPQDEVYRAHGFQYSGARADPNNDYQEYAEQEEVTYSNKEIRNAYTTLQVDPKASPKELKTAYRKMIARYHPDRAIANGLDEKEIAKYNEITQRINEAWSIICKVREL